jgi:hypothetical protein
MEHVFRVKWWILTEDVVASDRWPFPPGIDFTGCRESISLQNESGPTEI